MAMANLSVWIDSWHETEQQENLKFLAITPEILEELEGLIEPKPPPHLTVFGMSTGSSAHHRFERVLQYFLDRHPRPRFFYTTFERTRIEPAITTVVNQFDGVWVPCEANRAALIAGGAREDIIRVFPHVHYATDPYLRLPLPTSSRNFYWIGRWEPRKAPDNLIRAFMRAFKPGEAHLTLKSTGWPIALGRVEGFPAPAEAVEQERRAAGWSETEAAENVEVISKMLTRQQMLDLVARSDVYCSASRGEGFDLPSYEAKLAGRRVVTTDSGGPVGFLTDNDFLVRRTRTLPANPKYLWGEGAEWGDYDFDELVTALRAAAREAPLTERDNMTLCRAERVGYELRRWFQEILAK